MTVVLVAEDEPRIASFVRRGLSGAGMTALFTTDGWAAYRLARRGGIDLVLLDGTLPRLDGFEVLRRLRAAGSDVPVVMMLDRDALWDSVARLKGSADDYVVKPFCFERLLAKIERLLVPRPGDEPAVLSHGGLHLDVRACRAHVGGYWVDLSARECALAEIFLRHPGETLSREELHRHVWGDDETHTSNLVDVYVTYLRRKLGAHRFTSRRGMGYRLELVH
ncbi:two-component system response regulator [Mycobacterium sp. Soil538]|nr:two-component system response regulator [Mycobacterium sp. Soil538]